MSSVLQLVLCVGFMLVLKRQGALNDQDTPQNKNTRGSTQPLVFFVNYSSKRIYTSS